VTLAEASPCTTDVQSGSPLKFGSAFKRVLSPIISRGGVKKSGGIWLPRSHISEQGVKVYDFLFLDFPNVADQAFLQLFIFPSAICK